MGPTGELLKIEIIGHHLPPIGVVCAGSPESLGAFSTQPNGEVHRFFGTNRPVSFLEIEMIV